MDKIYMRSAEDVLQALGVGQDGLTAEQAKALLVIPFVEIVKFFQRKFAK